MVVESDSREKKRSPAHPTCKMFYMSNCCLSWIAHVESHAGGGGCRLATNCTLGHRYTKSFIRMFWKNTDEIRDFITTGLFKKDKVNYRGPKGRKA